jgi:hypothetical protein
MSLVNKIIEHFILRRLGVDKGKRRGKTEYSKGKVSIRKK